MAMTMSYCKHLQRKRCVLLILLPGTGIFVLLPFVHSARDGKRRHGEVSVKSKDIRWSPTTSFVVVTVPSIWCYCILVTVGKVSLNLMIRDKSSQHLLFSQLLCSHGQGVVLSAVRLNKCWNGRRTGTLVTILHILVVHKGRTRR
jgi:hypothetical protein